MGVGISQVVCSWLFSLHCESLATSRLLGIFSGGSDGKESACNAGDCNAGDPGSTPGLGRSPGKRNGNLHQYSCLEYSRDRGA